MSRTNTDEHGDPIKTEPWTRDFMRDAGLQTASETICKAWMVGIGTEGRVYLKVGTRKTLMLYTPTEDGPPTSGVIRRACELAYALGKNDGVADCVRETNRIMQDEETALLELSEPTSGVEAF